MLPTGSHSLSRVSSCDEGVYRMYTTEKQGEKRPRYAKQRKSDIIKPSSNKFVVFKTNINFVSTM